MKFVRQNKKLVIWLCIFAFLAAFWYYQNNTIHVNKVNITSDKVKDDITIVQITDLHGALFGVDNKSLISKIEKQKPDFICVTGDMFTREDEKGQDTAEKLIIKLAEKNAVYFVPGEHDKNEASQQALISAGVKVLNYDMDKIIVGDTVLNIYGINNVYYSDTFDLLHEYAPPNQQEFNLLLAHIPNFEAFSRFGVDLTLSGDSHGGQVRLPFIGALNYDNVWFPKFMYGGEYYDKGLYELDGSKLFVSVGLGSFPVPIRLFNRPEIAVIHLTSNNLS